MKRLYSTLAFSIVVTFVFAQTPSINWQRTLGGAGLDFASGDILEHPDSGEIFVLGHSDSDASGEKTEDSRGFSDLWILKLDSDGSILWDKTVGGINSDFGFAKGVLKDNKLFVLTSSISPISGDKTSENFGSDDYWLVCLDFDGNILWDKSYGGDSSDEAVAIAESGENLLLLGTSSSGISGNKTDDVNGADDYWILEVTSEDGSIGRQKSIGSEDIDFALDIAVHQDSYFLMGTSMTGANGDKTDPGFGGSDIWMVHLDQEFNVLADRCLGGVGNEFNTGVLISDGTNIFFLNSSYSGVSGNKTAINYGERDYWVGKLDSDLNLVWDASFGGTFREYATALDFLSDGNLVVHGNSESGISGTRTVDRYGPRDLWLVMLDTEGNELNQEAYGGGGEESSGTVSVNQSGEISILSSSNSDASGVKTEDSRGGLDYWVLQLDNYVSVEEFKQTDFQLKTFPNPFHDEVHFDLTEIKGSSLLSIYSGEGKLVFRQRVQNQNSFTWKSENGPRSTFFYELKTEEKVYRGKLMKN